MEIIAVYLLNKGCKLVLINLYEQREKKFHWDGNALKKVRKKKIKEFIEYKLRLKEKDKIKELYQLLKDESDRNKINGYFNIGLFLTIAIPIWNQASKNIIPEDINLKQFVYLIIFIAIGVYVLAYLVWQLKQLFDELIIFKGVKLKKLSEFVKEIYIEHND
ncbi:hypothetical protein MKY85_07825 [Paenibacillus sp. FSL R5-0749]|uniref:hypothetical protein n=1 Tax=Paenibacillus sp. FSL R5-0749 TaxID=2921657 RepID=UPI003159D4EB